MKTIQIHGKNYVPVSERIKEAGLDLVGVETIIMQHEPVVVIKAIITINKENREERKFTGISSANPAKVIEKTNPYEVAETSAVGRALGFAGYGIDEGIASADEVNKYPEETKEDNMPSTAKQTAFILRLLDEKGFTQEKLKTKYKVENINDLTSSQASTIIENLIKLPQAGTNEEVIDVKPEDEVNPNDIPDTL